MVGKAFGAAGANVVIQEFLEGIEVSLHALCDGKTAKIVPDVAGPQTRARRRPRPEHRRHGHLFADAVSDRRATRRHRAHKILEPFMRGCVAEGIDYRGLLYPGVMLTKAGPKILEFNARFGDPGNAGLSDAPGK